MRKNEFDSKSNSRSQSTNRTNRSKTDRPYSKGGKPKSARGAGADSKGGTKSGFGERREDRPSFGRKNTPSTESGYREQTRSTDWSTGGYRVTKKALGRSSGFKGYIKDDSQELRGRSPEDRKTFDNRGKTYDRREKPYENKKTYEGRRTTEDKGYKKEQGFKGPRRGPGNEASYNGPKKGYVKKAPRLPEDRRTSPKLKIDEYEVGNNLVDNQISDNIDRDDRVEGRNSVFEAIRSGRPLNKLFVEKDSEDVLISRIIAMAREKDIPIQYLERKKLDSISQTRTHQGVILEVAAREYVEVEDILEIAQEKGEKPFILVLDGITDTNNLGSIIRSAECAGVHGIILPKRRSATLNATVAKVAAGALEYVPVARVTNLVQTLRTLKNEGIWVIGADMDGTTDYNDADLTGPCALVIGSEGEGLARLVKDECDLMVRIPMKGKISSLNAGVAAALIMFEISNQRK